MGIVYPLTGTKIAGKVILKNENLKKIEQARNEINRFLDLKEKSLLKLKNIKNSILNFTFSGKLVN